MNRRLFLRAVAAAGLLGTGIGAAACSSEETRGGPPPGTPVGSLTVGLTYTPDIQFAPFYVAAEKGYFRDANLDVTLRHHGANEPLFGAIQAGQEQVVYAGGDEMMQARSQGVPLVNFATYYQTYPVVLVVPEDSPIRTPADLRGRSVGVPGPFGETWFGLLALLKQAGLTEQDVEIENIGYTQQAALTANQVDAVMGYANNDAVRLQAAGVAVRTIPIAEGTVPLVGVGLGAPDVVMMARTNDLTELHRAVAAAIGDIVANPEEAVTLSEKYIPGLAGDAQRQSALATLRATIPLFGAEDQWGRQNSETWEAMSAFMEEMGLLAKPVPASEAYTATVSG